MSSVYRGSVIESLGRLFAAGTATALCEGQLLERFITQGDPAAFEAILQRHGPMVLRVCQRVLDDPNDVDDAFQATFLILVKKAASIRDRDVLGIWLYGVARRVAIRARINARRRRSCERSRVDGVSMAKSHADPSESIELRAVLDDELERLPARYRAPLVLCDLEGQTQEQAAAALRCPVGTVKSRLSRGRERLRARLLRRGVAPAGAMALFVAADKVLAVPAELQSATLRLATQLASGKAAAAGIVSAEVASLVQSVMRSMIAANLKVAAWMAAAITLALTGFETLVFVAPQRPAVAAVHDQIPAPAEIGSVPKLEKPAKQAEPGSERFVLANGLTVLLRPVKGTNSTALVVLYAIGGDHDPEGQKSGLTHMLEHVYVTAPTGQVKARTADEFAARYAEGANAQTGDRYTVFAAVFPKNDLDNELKEAAARMGDLRLTDLDVARERPRLAAEVGNMFGDIPVLAALNHARELVRPTPGGGRRGGLPAHVSSLTAQELQAYWNRYYKPRNAILALAGAVDRATALERIKAHFGQLPSGENVPAPHEPGPAKLRGELKVLTVNSPVPDAESTACLAYPAPMPDSDLYAPFLVLVSRLWAAADKLGAGGPTGSAVYFTPLDDGAVIALSTSAKPGETAAQAVTRIEAFVADTIAPKLRPFELLTGRQRWGPFLGWVDMPDMFLANNIYGVAFSLGRREQLGISPTALRRAWDAVTEEKLRRAASEVFAPDRHAGAFIVVEK